MINHGPFPTTPALRLAAPTRAAGPAAGDAEYASWDPKAGGLKSVWVSGYFQEADDPRAAPTQFGCDFSSGSDLTVIQYEPPRSSAAHHGVIPPGADAGGLPAASDAPPVAAAGGAPFFAASDEMLMTAIEDLSGARAACWLRHLKPVTYEKEIVDLNDRPAGVSGGVR